MLCLGPSGENKNLPRKAAYEVTRPARPMDIVSCGLWYIFRCLSLAFCCAFLSSSKCLLVDLSLEIGFMHGLGARPTPTEHAEPQGVVVELAELWQETAASGFAAFSRGSQLCRSGFLPGSGGP